MTSKEYNTIVAEIKERLAKLEAAQPAEDPPKPPHPPHPRWRPIFNEHYYFIRDDEIREFIWNEDGHDNAFYSVGNVFMTQEAAKFAVERQKVIAEMREWAGNWDDPYILYYNHISRYVGTTYTQNTNLTYGEMRFATKEDAENCIKAVGVDRIKKYYIGVPDDE